MKKVKITVMRIARYDDLIEKYENPIERPCGIERVGQIFISENAAKPDDLCDSAWETMAPFVKALSDGETGLFDGWMKNERAVMLSCNDGLRPVSFYVEALDGDDADL